MYITCLCSAVFAIAWNKSCVIIIIIIFFMKSRYRVPVYNMTRTTVNTASAQGSA